MNPADIPEIGAEAAEEARGAGGPFQGDGLASPHKSSKDVSRQKLGSLIFGSSEAKE